MNDDLISRAWLKKATENLVAGGAERLKDYYENGSKSEENEWIGGVYDVWELIDNAPPAEPQKIVTIPPELIEKLAKCLVDIVGNIDWEKAIEAYKARPQDEIIKELWNCRNELCLKCERYKEAWNGACEDCRYNFVNMQKWKKAENER